MGVISLADDLDVETVTEIFIRINSKGVALSSADFAMSKIAAYGERGSNLRKLIDYFCELSVSPHVYEDIQANDPEFATSGLLGKIAWLRAESEDLYNPTYSDIIRVATLLGFKRGRPSAPVAYLSGRDFETRANNPDLVEPAFDRLEHALGKIVNKYNFKQFMIIIRSVGFIVPSMIRAANALNFAYALYLMLTEDKSISHGERQRIVRRWFVMSMLTGRHSGSFESQWEQDVRRIGEAELLARIEASALSESFWNVTLPERLNTASESPAFKTFLAAQVHGRAKGFLSKTVTVQSLLEQMGDVHHIVPKDYLVKSGITDRRDYNQAANFVMAETPVNIAISNRPPAEYMGIVSEQVGGGKLRIGEITDAEILADNLRQNAVPESLASTDAASYRDFLDARRQLMAQMLKEYEAL